MKFTISVELLEGVSTGPVSIKAFDGRVQIISQGLEDTMKIALVAIGIEQNKQSWMALDKPKDKSKETIFYINNVYANNPPAFYGWAQADKKIDNCPNAPVKIKVSKPVMDYFYASKKVSPLQVVLALVEGEKCYQLPEELSEGYYNGQHTAPNLHP